MQGHLTIGDHFDVQFVWQIPADEDNPRGDIIRAVFNAEILAVIDAAEKYLVQLTRFVAGRQESADGQTIRPQPELAFAYWRHVLALRERKVTLAWEVADGRPLQMRLTTLTGEHDFFRRYNQPADQMRLDSYGRVQRAEAE